LRESHLRFKIGPREREAWMTNMVKALEDVPFEVPVRLALRTLFERSSAYIVNAGQGGGEPAASENLSEDHIHREIAQRWGEQCALDDLVVAIRDGDGDRGLELTQSGALKARFARDRAVLAHALGLIMANGSRHALMEYAEREVRDDPALGHVHNRYGRTLLHDASAHGNVQFVELLLGLGADPNVKSSGGHTPLYWQTNAT
jgi:hypothetical protein